MRIVILSDLHLTYPEEKALNNYDVNDRFLQIISHLKTTSFNRIIVLGDTCLASGEAEIYNWFFDQLDTLDKPYHLVSGNHDHSEMLIQILNQPTADVYDKKIYFLEKIDGRPFLFLDTSEGIIDDKQLDWLKNKLYELEEEVWLVMHHPPCNGGVPYMDSKHYLQNRREVLNLLKSHFYTVNVLCGHYHVDKDLQFKNVKVHICPSPYFTLDQRSNEFIIEEQVASYKILDFKDGTYHLATVSLPEDFKV